MSTTPGKLTVFDIVFRVLDAALVVGISWQVMKSTDDPALEWLAALIVICTFMLERRIRNLSRSSEP